MSDRASRRRAERIALLIDRRLVVVDPAMVRTWRFDGQRVTAEMVDLLARLNPADLDDASALIRLDIELRPAVLGVVAMDDARRVIEAARGVLRPGSPS